MISTLPITKRNILPFDPNWFPGLQEETDSIDNQKGESNLIPYQGLIADVLSIIALIVLWEKPIPTLWWIILGVLVASFLFTQTVKTSLKDYGMYDTVTKTWGIIATVFQLLLIGLSVYALIL